MTKNIQEFLSNAGGLKIDSRQIEPGDVFIALQGISTDGCLFIDQAVAKGAIAVLAEKQPNNQIDIPVFVIKDLRSKLGDFADFYYGQPSKKLKVIGVTGTNGKTSTCHFIAQLFAAAGKKCAVMGTLGNGFLGSLNKSDLTTTDCPSIHKQLADFYAQGAEFVAMEVSSHALEQQRLAGIEFSTAIFTNLSQDHLDYHQDMANYFAAKSKLFTELNPKNSIINQDDFHGQQLIEKLPTAIAYTKINNLPKQIAGEYNKSNIAAAVTCCEQYNIECDLSALAPVTGRMQIIAQEPQIVVDFAHTPDALSKVLSGLANPVITVFGCGGERDQAKRPMMLKTALSMSKHVIITQDNSRSEDPQKIISDIVGGVADNQKFTIEPDRKLAIKLAIKMAEKNDTVLIAGKGHETTQTIGKQTINFNDAEVAAQIIKELNNNV